MAGQSHGRRAGGRAAAYASDVDALDWLTGELPNVLAVLEDAFLDRHYELVWQLCEALWELMLYRRPFAEWLRSHELGIIAAQRCSDPVAESRLHYQLGRAHLDLDQQDLAARENQLAVDLAQAAGDRRTESAALEQLGRIAQARNDLDTAIECFTASCTSKRPRHPAGCSRDRRLGDAYVHAGRYDDAELHLIIAQQMFAELAPKRTKPERPSAWRASTRTDSGSTSRSSD
ncbi:hypothetical protein [Amycolatopsis australiensis]|uniref:Tetratricopeptide repeat-containing protein n=1 Tax=Amycolatopsis australiensis TaxID=546364 RepID=A0A1K1LNV2_9PSEU|nr:hypothetical protein [Amycolatopsis australiensis]SFW12560.1 hypothetical protein SAMN04489730_0093 [Amycolatopsis australiensis]